MYDKNMVNEFLQLFILGVNGDSIGENPNIQYCLKNNLGGIIFFTQNIITENRFKNFVNDLKKVNNSKLFLSIDQEGGRVERTENIHGGKKYKSPAVIFSEGVQALERQTYDIAGELRNYGLNMNFAPVADVNSNPQNPIIGERAFSSNTKEVSDCVNLVAKTYLKSGIIPVLKHFPGHGDTSVDSHLSLPVVDMEFKKFENIHIKPFIDNLWAPAVMVSHVHYKMFDTEETPATMSQNVIQNYLIKKLNYQGIIISDDMVMGALDKIEPPERIIRGLLAGLSMFIYRNSNDDTIDVIEQTAKEVQKSKFLSARVDEACQRIDKIKKLVNNIC